MPGSTKYPQATHYLFCNVCQGEYSSDAGDYFAATSDIIFECHDVPMVLVRKGGRFKGDKVVKTPITVGELSHD